MKIYIPQKGCFKHVHVIEGIGYPFLYYKDGGGVTDGIGRQHITLYGKCDVCNKEIRVANIHVDKNGSLYGLEPNIEIKQLQEQLELERKWHRESLSKR